MPIYWNTLKVPCQFIEIPSRYHANLLKYTQGTMPIVDLCKNLHVFVTSPQRRPVINFFYIFSFLSNRSTMMFNQWRWGLSESVETRNWCRKRTDLHSIRLAPLGRSIWLDTFAQTAQSIFYCELSLSLVGLHQYCSTLWWLLCMRFARTCVVIKDSIVCCSLHFFL